MAAPAVVFEEKLRIPLRITSLAKFRKWARSEEFPERGIAFIGGEIEVDMSPEELTHNRVKGDIYGGLWTLNEAEDLGELFTDGVLLTNVEADVSTEPDMVFISYESITSGAVRYVESFVGSDRFIEIEGAPDLVLEVVSVNSVRKDTVLLRERYWTAGVKEYWLADARSREVTFQILRREDDGWDAPAAPGSWQLSRVFSRKFRLKHSVNRLGDFRYRLESRRVG